jgi:CDP-diacylglycerol--serine O-phosphatidyltransferase
MRMRLKKFRNPSRPPIAQRRLGLSLLPTLLTLGNGACGLAGIAVVISEHLPWSDPSKLFAAGLLIFGGMLFDALDGRAARLTRQTSAFGAQLDSLCDMITFGVTPAVILWRFNDLLPQRLIWGVGALFALCVALRLARFNAELEEQDQHEQFVGLPSPAAAGTIAAFAIALPQAYELSREGHSEWVRQIGTWLLTGTQFLLPVMAVGLAYLMVSRIIYPHFVHQWFGGRVTPFQIGQALFALVAIVVAHELALPLILCYYALESPLRTVWRGSPAPATPPVEAALSKVSVEPVDEPAGRTARHL